MDKRPPKGMDFELSEGEPAELVLGDGVEDKFLSLFLMVEFQKFLISLSVLPGNRAAICDHLHFIIT